MSGPVDVGRAVRGRVARFARRVAGLAALVGLAPACGGGTTVGGATYPERERGCAVKAYPSAPPVAVDELGVVQIDCSTSQSACTRQLLDEVCARGGDVAWGLADNALTATHLVAHAAHTRRETRGAHERGCPVQVFPDAPIGIKTENIGPVAAVCAPDDTREVCLRELEDQVCLLGGDVLWQVEGPFVRDEKQRMSGRAAHTR